jgi:GDPmannose 4,6-dehydratase
MNNKTALITGIAGQDGSYLSEFLLFKGYNVIGTLKRNSAPNSNYRIEHIKDKIFLEYCDVTDMSSLIKVMQKYEPSEIYHLAALSDVRISFDQPVYTAFANSIGTLNVLEAMKSIVPNSKMYNAGSSEQFGNNIDDDGYQRETTPMIPVSPYGVSKVFAHNICQNYKNSYNMFVSCARLFNHESPRRGMNFVTNKVIHAAVNIKNGKQNELKLGNLNASRDWGHAKDYTKAMWLMLQHNKPDDFICATGVSHTVKQLVEYVFGKLDLDWKKYVKKDEKFLRPEELHFLKGDASKIKKILSWEQEYTFETMLDEMLMYCLEKN